MNFAIKSLVIPIIASAFKGKDPTTNMDSHKEVISRLKFIGKVQKYEKINVKFMYVQPDGIATTISRTINQDNRRHTLSFVQNVVARSFEIVEKYVKSKDHSEQLLCQNILDDLKLAKNGLVNLKDTYVSDIYFCCQIDTLLEEIDSKLGNFSLLEEDEDNKTAE